MRSDEELLRGFAGGERRALGLLAERYERALLSLACAILGSRDLAVDAVQETWLRVILYADGFAGRSSVKTWLYRIAINQCRSMVRARPGNGGEEAGGDTGQDVADVRGDPVDLLAVRDETERLKRAVEGLSPLLREAVVLCYTQQMSHEEAGEVMGVPVGTVKSRVHAALEELRKRLTPG